MTGLKRTVRRFGPVRGHRAGLHGSDLLDYRTARERIYLPAYHWVLEHRAADLVARLRAYAQDDGVVLLDYTTNGDLDDLRTPLSHAALIARHIRRGAATMRGPASEKGDYFSALTRFGTKTDRSSTVPQPDTTS
jgi:hypothetical protein